MRPTPVDQRSPRVSLPQTEADLPHQLHRPVSEEGERPDTPTHLVWGAWGGRRQVDHPRHNRPVLRGKALVDRSGRNRAFLTPEIRHG